jgi:hypothetical protein
MRLSGSAQVRHYRRSGSIWCRRQHSSLCFGAGMSCIPRPHFLLQICCNTWSALLQFCYNSSAVYTQMLEK